MPDLSLEQVLEIDPKHLLFALSRYKFVSKMLTGYGRVLEVGCGSGFGSMLVAKTVGRLTATDPDVSQTRRIEGIEYLNYDIAKDPSFGTFDAVYCVDVFEHIASEAKVLEKLRALAPVCIIGTPSRESQEHASVLSRAAHVNCKSGIELRFECLDHWSHVFMFGMNDEVLHTGFMPMCNYLFALCIE